MFHEPRSWWSTSTPIGPWRACGDFVFQEAGITIRGNFDVYPSDRQILEALGDRHLVVILDELEQGIRMIGNDALRRQNISFLQMLSELGNRNPQVTLMASVYDAGEEPGLTLIRVPNVRVQFARATLADHARVALHRVFENYLEFDRNAAMPVIESLLNVWQRHLTVFDLPAIKGQLLDSYPFHPELLTLIWKKFPPGADLADRETTTRLHDLDPSGDLINRARSNMEELATAPHQVAATTLLYTLAGDGRMRGARSVSRELADGL